MVVSACQIQELNPQIWDKSQQKNFSRLINGHENQEVHEKQAILWLENIYIRLKLATFQHLLLVLLLPNIKTFWLPLVWQREEVSPLVALDASDKQNKEGAWKNKAGDGASGVVREEAELLNDDGNCGEVKRGQLAILGAFLGASAKY